MDPTVVGLLVAFVAVVAVLVWVWGTAHYGERRASEPPSPRTVRRMARVSVVVGAAQLVYAVLVAVLAGELGRAALFALGGTVLLANGISMLRNQRHVT